LVLTSQFITTLQDLYGFFSTLCLRLLGPQYLFNDEKDIENILQEIEHVLSLDFLEKMPPLSK